MSKEVWKVRLKSDGRWVSSPQHDPRTAIKEVMISARLQHWEPDQLEVVRMGDGAAFSFERAQMEDFAAQGLVWLALSGHLVGRQVGAETFDAQELPSQRAKVPGGWLVSRGPALAFVPDPDHAWDGRGIG